MSDSVLEFPTLLNDAYEYLEAHKNQTLNIVCFVELDDGTVTFLSTGHDISLLYHINKRIESEMDSIVAEKYEVEED